MSKSILDLFRKQKPGEGKAPASSENPYLNARRNWNEYTGSVVNSRRIWQTVALMSLMITLAAVAGLIYVASQSKFIPYIIEVDRLGQIAAIGRAERAATFDSRLIHAAVASFVQDARSVSFDRYQQNNAVWRVYSMLRSGDPATSKMTIYMKDPDTSPTTRAGTVSVGVEIRSVLQQTPETWEVTWVEKTWDKNGTGIGQTTMRGLITVYISPPTTSTTEEEIRRNPIGVYVRDYNWTRVTVDSK